MYRILLTDSDADRARQVRDALMESGFDVVTASGAVEAKEMFEFVRPDVAVVDDDLEDGSGSELCRDLKATPLGAECAFVLATDDVLDHVDACVARPLAASDVVMWCEHCLPGRQAAVSVDEGHVVAGEDATTGPVDPVVTDPAEVAEPVPVMCEVAVDGHVDPAAEEILEEAVAEVVAGAGAPSVVRSSSEHSDPADRGEDIADHLDTIFSGKPTAGQPAPAKLSPPVEIRTTDIDMPERVGPHAQETPSRSSSMTGPATPPESSRTVEIPPVEEATVVDPAMPVDEPSTAPVPLVADLPSRQGSTVTQVVLAPPADAAPAAGVPRWMIGVAAAGLAVAVVGWIFLGGERQGLEERQTQVARNAPASPVTEAPVVGAPANAAPAAIAETEVVEGPVAEIPVVAEPVTTEEEPAVAVDDAGPTPVVADDATPAAVATAGPALEPETAVADPEPEAVAVAAVEPPPVAKPRVVVEPKPVPAPEPPPATGFTSPVLIERPDPVFDESLLAGADGVLVLSLLVDPEGRVDRVIVDRAVEDLALEQAAVDAVVSWRYRAAMQDGAAVAAWTTARFEF